VSAYNEIVDSYYRAWFRFHPDAAVDTGVEGYSDKLAPYGDDDIGALVTLNEKLLDAVSELNEDELDEDQRIDLQLMTSNAILESKKLIDQDWRIKDPTRFVPVNAIYQLTLRPVKDRCAALKSRLNAIPGYLRGAKSHLLTEPECIPAIWLESAITEAEEGVKYFRQLPHHPFIEQCRIDAEIEKAAHALEEFARFMKKDLLNKASGSFACGREMFDLRLEYVHGLNINAERLYQFGQQLYDRTWQELVNITKTLQGDDDIHSLTEKIQKQYRPDGNLLDIYKENMQAAYDFLVKKSLVSLPRQQFLHVIETPAFLQHQIPFAAYLDPMPTDPSQTAYYYVTPPADEESWGEHNLVSLRHTCVHEAWPGHHLQFVTANLNPVSHTLPRLLNPSATLYEGWALYSEQLMVEQGFLEQKESEFVLLKDRLWRALRVMLDVELHAKGHTLDSCVTRMQEKLGFSHSQALAELSWYSQSPTVPMGYATGWALINATRDRLRGMDKDFDLKDFHDRLLSSGSIGLPWAIQRNFGKPMWESIRSSVFVDEAVAQP
jgi:uncharacterized protein (DUF885 family)